MDQISTWAQVTQVLFPTDLLRPADFYVVLFFATRATWPAHSIPIDLTARHYIPQRPQSDVN